MSSNHLVHCFQSTAEKNIYLHQYNDSPKLLKKQQHSNNWDKRHHNGRVRGSNSEGRTWKNEKIWVHKHTKRGQIAATLQTEVLTTSAIMPKKRRKKKRLSGLESIKLNSMFFGFPPPPKNGCLVWESIKQRQRALTVYNLSVAFAIFAGSLQVPIKKTKNCPFSQTHNLFVVLVFGWMAAVILKGNDCF